MTSLTTNIYNATLDCSFAPYLGSYSFFSSITTHPPGPPNLINAFFQQGITHAFGFNQPEALNSFACCLEQDETNAMCHWGMSYGFGPFLNKPKSSDQDLSLAVQYSRLAESYLDDSYKPEEIALVKATRLRFPNTQTPQSEASKNYRDAMKALVTKTTPFSNHADMLTLYAESEMDLSMSLGLDYYKNSKQTTHGDATESTANALKALHKVMLIAPDHTMALHLFIHATEPLTPGTDASQGEQSADLLKDLNLYGSGHLEHMPGHLFLRVGRYNDVIQNNILASTADDLYDLNGHIPYGPAHNVYFLSVAAQLDGQSQVAITYADKMRDIYETGHFDDGPGAEEGWNALLLAYLRFGMYDKVLSDVLSLPPPAGLGLLEGCNYAELLGNFARGVANFKTGKLEEASSNLKDLESIFFCADFNSRYHDRSVVAKYTLESLIEGDVTKLKAAADEQNSWAYNSPPHWSLSSNTCLGEMYMKTTQFESALASFRADLTEYPNNPWGLYGLYEAMAAMPETYDEEEVAEALAAAEKAWERSDQVLKTSCYTV
ncbi:hypothetical protein TrVE_jg350 [Triparma verrucosa]|uniref:Uncharacterized protein n=1 Tax=Triparma verrucosa TaxID=1606542 RepID=A0A9W7F327_9STRA|nr:hypothetical protein TrVE_jg350 [Triparma verrucosa]